MSVGQIRIMKCWGALFQPRGPPLALFLAILWPLLTQHSHIWLWAASAAPNGLNVGWTWLNIVFHIRGGHLGPFRPPEIANLGPQNHRKMFFFWHKMATFGLFLAKKKSFWGVLGPPNNISVWSKRPKLTPPDVENNVQPCSPNVQPIWGRWDCLWPPLAILDQKKP